MSSYDPRKELREVIGEEKAVNPDSWDEQYCLTISHEDISYDIPIYLCEESRSKDLPSFPFIEINLMKVDYTPCDVGALKRKHEAYLDVTLYYTENDMIDTTSFGKDVLDELVSQVRDNQESCQFNRNTFINVGQVRLRKEDSGKQVVYQYVIEVYAIYYD